MNAIDLLIQDHQGAKKVMDEIILSEGKKKKELFAALKKELELHDYLEETFFYPAVLTHPEAAGFGPKDKEAHKVVEDALAKLVTLPVDDPDWGWRFSAMRERLIKHIADEEEHLFVDIRGMLSASELDALGEKMKVEKTKAKAV